MSECNTLLLLAGACGGGSSLCYSYNDGSFVRKEFIATLHIIVLEKDNRGSFK